MKLFLKALVALFVLSLVARSEQGAAHQRGQCFAHSLVGNVAGAAKSTNPHSVPGFQTDKPKEASLQATSLGDTAFQVSGSNDAAQHIISSARERKSFKLDPQTDPLFVQANEAIANPQKPLKEEIVEDPDAGQGKEETKVCEESGDETLESGEETREVTVTQPPVAQHQVQLYNPPSPHFPLCVPLTCNVVTGVISLNGSPYPNTLQLLDPLPAHLRSRVIRVERDNTFSCQGQTHYFSAPFSSSVINFWNRIEFVLKKYSTFTPDGVFSYNPRFLFFLGWSWGQRYDLSVSFTIFYQEPITENDIKERIDSNCQYLEERVDQGLCIYEDVIVLEGPQTRVINDYPVTRDWWKRKKIYRCHYPARNDCAPLRERGCYQVNSVCKQKVQDTCVVWEQTYRCPSGRQYTKRYRSSSKSSPFCFTGDCADASYQANGEMMNVISQLSVLREVQEDLRNYKVIFKGTGRSCTRHCIGFKDCCGPGNGWGISFRLANCDKDEEELRELRNKKLCVQVGTYCAEKVLGVCIRKKTSFCCYGTKMARLIQENGKAQLGKGFGTPEGPECSGLSAEELSRIDFSRINFSEIFEEVRSKMVPKGQGKSLAMVSTERLRGNMSLLTQPSLNPQKQQATQTLKEKGF